MPHKIRDNCGKFFPSLSFLSLSLSATCVKICQQHLTLGTLQTYIYHCSLLRVAINSNIWFIFSSTPPTHNSRFRLGALICFNAVKL